MDTPNHQISTNPFRDWPNDDLLMSNEMRDRVRKEYPNLSLLVDWQELRELFAPHESIANESKIHVKKRGRLIVLLGIVGLTLAATTGLVEDNVTLKAILGAIATLSSGLSLGLGAMFRLRNSKRRAWLHSRYICLLYTSPSPRDS